MCTVSWLRRVDGYELFCNRDERRSRLPARHPCLHTPAGHAFLAPVDGDAGGSWISVNRAGLALCLLNDYQAPEPDELDRLQSRGLLVRDLADAQNVEEALVRLKSTALDRLRGFVLLALGPEPDEIALAHWDTRALRVEPRPPQRPLLVSSGWNGLEVRARREELFDRTVGVHALTTDPETLRARHLAFHASPLPEHGALSPCMHRADAGTVSTSRVVVGLEGVHFAYRSGAPCESGEVHTLDLERAGRA